MDIGRSGQRSWIECVRNRRTASASVALLVGLVGGCSLFAPGGRWGLAPDEAPKSYLEEHYTKTEHMIPMRDGVRLHTAIYAPRDPSISYPIILYRTPYSVRPYGEDVYPASSPRGIRMDFVREGFIFVMQDVRGRFMSEGTFTNMTPHIDTKRAETDVDESSDTYDTIEWVLENVPNHNGRVGMLGISYPGFYAAAGMIDAHPALVAVSPQAPIADWFFDDFHHHGAFFLPHAFNFMAVFGLPRPEPTTNWGPRFKHGTPDGYQFFLDLGSLRNANDRYLHDEIEIWNQCVEHPNYDAFWQARNLLPHLHKVAPAVMTVGGWFDAEDLYGALKIYRAVEQRNPEVFNVLVMGPWSHGGWSRRDGRRLGNVDFEADTSLFYREKIELPFFRHFLKDEPWETLPEAYVFETGVNQWRTFEHWPPTTAEPVRFYLDQGGRMTQQRPAALGEAFDEYVSDPAKPVPSSQDIATGMPRNYMTDDQRFAARRPDVLVYQTDVLDAELTLAGPVVADLWVSTSGTASDWIVKLIDVFPPDTEDLEEMPNGMHLGGYQMMVRSEVIRGRFRNSYAHPEPFVPNTPTNIKLELQDVLHTFQPGHRMMVQIQSTWFPMVDRNPQKYVDNIFLADESDFNKATQRVYRSKDHATHLLVGVLPRSGE